MASESYWIRKINHILARSGLTWQGTRSPAIGNDVITRRKIRIATGFGFWKLYRFPEYICWKHYSKQHGGRWKIVLYLPKDFFYFLPFGE